MKTRRSLSILVLALPICFTIILSAQNLEENIRAYISE